MSTSSIFSDPMVKEIEEIARRILAEQETNHVEPFVDAKVAARHIGVKENTLRSWASTKYQGCPVHKFGKSVRFKLSELEKWAKVGRE